MYHFENKFIKDSEPIVDPTNGFEPLQNIGSSSSNKKKVSDTPIESRRSQRPRKEKHLASILIFRIFTRYCFLS